MFHLLQKDRDKAHHFSTENGEKSKQHNDKETCDHKFQIGDKVLISNNFNTG